jgi:HSP20 family protein
MREIDVWDPFKKIRRMEKLNKFFNEDWFPISVKMPSELIREPLLDVKDLGKALEVKAELPGVDKKDIDIEVNDRRLTLSAKVRVEKEEKDKGYYFKERKYQSYYRTIPLPTEVIPNKSKAEFTNGVLKLTLPKKTPTKPKKKSHKVKIK